MLSKRPRSVGATTLLGETGVWGKQDLVLGGAITEKLQPWGHWGFLPLSPLGPSQPDIPQQQQLRGSVQDGQQGAHQVLHTTLMDILHLETSQVSQQPQL